MLLASPDVAWNGLNSEWSRNITGREGKILVRIDDPEDAATEPEHVDLKIFRQDEIQARHVSSTVTVEDIEGTGSSWEIRLHGVHWPKAGALLFTTTSDKYAGIFGLPHLTTRPEFFESSQALLNRTLGSTLDKKERWTFTDQSDPWVSTIDAPAEAWNPTPHCEYLLYIQLHPLDHGILQVQPSLTGPENVIKAIHNIENELRFPQGTPHRVTPRLQMSAVLFSPDCAFFIESKGPPAYPPTDGEHLLGVKQEIFLYNVSTWLLGLAFVIFGQIQLLKVQLKESSTPSTLSRVSFYTASTMLLADGIIFAASASWSLSASNTLLPSLVVTCVSFLSMTISIFFLSEIHRVQESEWRQQEHERERQNPPAANASRPQQPSPDRSTIPPPRAPTGEGRPASPPIIIPSDQDIDAEIAEVNNTRTNGGSLPAPATASTPAADSQDNGTSISTVFGRFVLVGICILFLSVAAVTWRPTIRVAYFNIVAFVYLSMWTPQIYRNVYRNCRRALSWPFVVGQSILRLLPIAYFYIWSDNFALAEPDWTTFAFLAGWVWVQIWILIGQSVLGPRFGLPKGWLPEAWEYHPVLREDNIEAGGLPIGLVSMPNSPIIERVKSGDDGKDKKRTNIHVIDCAICREVLEVPVVKSGEDDPSAGGVAGVFARRMLDWVWVDTCCIDKSSSAELSEADVRPSTRPFENLEKPIRQARWFTRGWTLQEYLASSEIVLLNSAWQPLYPANFPSIKYTEGQFGLHFVPRLLTCVTGIDASRWEDASTATRLSWAAKRETSRLEDEAYCLLGILNVKMPLLYGEGSQAFSRLLGELIKKSNSHGVLAAWYGLPRPSLFHVLPTSPRAYAGCAREFKDVRVRGKPDSLHFTMTNAGLNIELPLIQIDSELKLALGILNCQVDDSHLAIVLMQSNDDEYGQLYHPIYQPLPVPPEFCEVAHRKNIYITDNKTKINGYNFIVHDLLLRQLGYDLASVYPPSEIWKDADGYSEITCETLDAVVILFTSNAARNIALFVSTPFSQSPPQILISLTNSTSAIGFLLSDEFINCQERFSRSPSVPLDSTWSSSINIKTLEARKPWGTHVDICVPGPPEGPGATFRISAFSPDPGRVFVINEEIQ
ncbi:hypothetical protein NPX13_g2017 [Xylaria arbuscula]|uniref:RING-type E3 ubiquitin transferase n=1 Tax=Xylaria arbuscula TaxID=114810 RepID=A0A9W8NLI7_9PEZI|nr:hypothetical protein NPX13_g2017 [Xylaria arbuscula]